MLSKELLGKFEKVIAENLVANESKIFVDLITSSEKIKKQNEDLIEENAELKEGNEEALEEITRIEKKLEDCCDEAGKSNKIHNKLKEELLSVKEELFKAELKGKQECLDKIFDLTKIVFKTPAKIREFDSPIENTTYDTRYDNNGNQITTPSGSYTTVQPCKEKTDVE